MSDIKWNSILPFVLIPMEETKKIEPIIRTVYNVASIEYPTLIGGYESICSYTMRGLVGVEYLVIDGVRTEIPEFNYGYRYQFTSTGLHTIDYVCEYGVVRYDCMLKNCPVVAIEVLNGIYSLPGGVFSSINATIKVAKDNPVYDSRNDCNGIIETSTNRLICGNENTVIPNTVTSIGSCAFRNCGNLTSITIPNSVTNIYNYAFYNCNGLTSIDIPSSVTSISDYAFQMCSSLTSITCNAVTAPTVTWNTFQSVKTGGTLYVPTGSTGYDTWMDTGNYYLGKYSWTKVEQ